MPIANTSSLFDLIKSLNKSEKRHFKLQAQRTNKKLELQFVVLFDTLDKMKHLDEVKLRKKFSHLSDVKLINTKRHLYYQLLKSLRLIHSTKEIDLQIREQLDFAKILYGKGLYLQSLKLLERIKLLAEEVNQHVLLLEILEFEKMIELKHITRSRRIKNKVESLIDDSSEVIHVTNNLSQLINFTLKISGLYIKIGHAFTERSRVLLKEYFYSHLDKFEREKPSFFEKIYLHHSYYWYYYILMDVPYCYRHSRKWVDLFQKNPIMMQKDPDLYMRGAHYLLTACFYLREFDTFDEYMKKLEAFFEEHSSQFNVSSHLIYLIYGFNAKINQYFLKGRYEKFLEIIPEIKEEIEKYSSILDPHRRIIFYYKFAWAYFCLNRYEEALDYLNNIINLKQEQLRADIFCYSRLVHLICHFKLGNHELVSNLLRSVNQSFEKNNLKNKAQVMLLEYIKSVLSSGPKASEAKLEALLEQSEKMSRDPEQIKHFMLFNYEIWARSIRTKKKIADITKAQYRNR